MESLLSPDDAQFELGQMLGSRRAFGTVAGRCSAADAACLRRMRDEKLYLSRANSWEEFCPQFLGLSKTQANRIIRYLDEFGAGYFELAQLTRITPDEFRALAPVVKDRSLHAGGEVIALLPENTDKIAAALEALRGQKPQAAHPFSALEKRCQSLASEFSRTAAKEKERLHRQQLAALVRRTIAALGRIELTLDV